MLRIDRKTTPRRMAYIMLALFVAFMLLAIYLLSIGQAAGLMSALMSLPFAAIAWQILRLQ